MSPPKPKPRPSPAAGSAGDELIDALGLPAPSPARRRRATPPPAPPAPPAKPVRITVDLAAADYAQLRTWGTIGRVAGSDIIRAALAHLTDNRPALEDVLTRAGAAKTERDRRRLGK